MTACRHVQARYVLEVSKMDGAGFLPLMQRMLVEHITGLPQVRGRVSADGWI